MSRVSALIVAGFIAVAALGIGISQAGTSDAAGLERPVITMEQVVPQLPSTCAANHSYFGFGWHSNLYHYHYTATTSGPMEGIYSPSGWLVSGTCRRI